jgi:hypothetical protein
MLKGLENQTYLIAYIISNVVALVLLYCASTWPRIGRLLFVLLFAWASWTNWGTALSTPEAYLDYANLTFLDLYRQTIHGWFSEHIVLAVGIIATCQALIAVSMLLKGVLFKIGAAGAILFLVGIAPLGVGAAFPATLIMALAMGVLMNKSHTYLWATPPVRDTINVSYPWRIN